MHQVDVFLEVSVIISLFVKKNILKRGVKPFEDFCAKGLIVSCIEDQ